MKALHTIGASFVAGLGLAAAPADAAKVMLDSALGGGVATTGVLVGVDPRRRIAESNEGPRSSAARSRHIGIGADRAV